MCPCQDLLQVVVLSALASMDFHELALTALVFVDGVISSIVVKNSSYKGLNNKSISCSDEAFMSASGETFGTSFELEGIRLRLPEGNNVVPLRFDTIQLVQNRCSIYELWSEDPNQHLKDFLKLVDSLDFDGENRERTRLCLFQFSLRYQARNWLERLPAGSITTWEDCTIVPCPILFHREGTAKLLDDILIVPNNIMENLSSDAWTHFMDLLQKNSLLCNRLWLQSVVKLRDRNAEESWALLEDLDLYDNESWNDPRDFAKPVKAIALPQDVPSTSDCHLIELENQVQRLMKAHLAPTQPTQVNKVTTSWEICSGPHDTQSYMEDPEQAFETPWLPKILLQSAILRGRSSEERELKAHQSFSPQNTSPLHTDTETIMNTLAPKRVHFVNSIVILSEESELKEGETTTNITPEHDHNITKEAMDEVKEVIDEEESEVETGEEIEEILEDE
ncbi:hypothetical protein Tco_0965534 [Tanacetum coccineum]